VARVASLSHNISPNSNNPVVFLLFCNILSSSCTDFDAIIAEFDFSEEEQDSEEEAVSFDEQFFTDFRSFKSSYYTSKLKYPSVNQ
jgi:hypothetical protein